MITLRPEQLHLGLEFLLLHQKHPKLALTLLSLLKPGVLRRDNISKGILSTNISHSLIPSNNVSHALVSHALISHALIPPISLPRDNRRPLPPIPLCNPLPPIRPKPPPPPGL